MTITAAKQQKIVELNNKGMSITEIAKKSKVSRPTVKNIIKESKSSKKEVPYSTLADNEGVLDAKAFEMFEMGKTPVQALIKLKMQPERMMKLHEYWIKMSKYCSGPLYDMADRLYQKNCMCGKKCWPLNIVLGQCQDGHIIVYGNEYELKIVSFGELRFLSEGVDEQEEED